MPWIERLWMRSGYIRRRLNNRKQGSPKTRDGSGGLYRRDIYTASAKQQARGGRGVTGDVISPMTLNLNGQHGCVGP